MSEPTTTETPEVDVETTEQTDPPEPEVEPAAETTEDEPDTFPREVVEKLRDENAKYRTRAKDRDEIAMRLHTALVAATGRLADPSDLDYADEHLADADALNAALDDLLDRKPHLASRRPRGDVGQGMGTSTTTTDLAGILRSRA